ncbi:uncharacterized protein LOC106644280 isoform X2 [Copidosoma floridanum]|uniref:uncharacterized protein LOC106644280 isoform X2 n=1 Tax=Copidosoma floridanum TaxID=29053 RepID=UPI0006C9A44F|nr:uncharacterized protein LOC106644280 isoform X2 [Copidosoma floridanum]
MPAQQPQACGTTAIRGAAGTADRQEQQKSIDARAHGIISSSTAAQLTRTLAQSEARLSTGADNESCCNPFRIPNHHVRGKNSLRNVPATVRECLTHVNFKGKRICYSCRMRVYEMLKERRVIKPSSSRMSLVTRGSSVATAAKRKQQQQQQQRKSEPTSAMNRLSQSAAPTPAPVTAVNRREEVESAMSTQESRERLPIPTTARDAVEQMAAIAPEHNNMSSVDLVDNLNRMSESTIARRTKSQLALPPDLCPSKQICCFCFMSENNELEFGKLYHYNGIVTHYYCLLLSSNMEQKGSDDQGILGFLEEDIQKEIRRGKRLYCSYCKKNGATLGCCNAKCKRIFHLPCGLKAGSLHQFFGEFRSYCINHRPRQKIDDRVKREIGKMSNILCYICYEGVKPLDSNGTLWAPCCKKNAWFHRRCVQQLAMSAGYFFKCPLCNNKREFQTAMLEYGIYIPRQDASWELVPNAFEELLYRHDRCDSKICQCAKGRTYTSSNGKWELILCRTCGSQGIHVLCGQLKWSNPTWDCPECTLILKNNCENTTDDLTSNSNEITRHGGNTLDTTAMDNNEDSDSDISVGNDSSPVDSSLHDIPKNIPQVKLRPGPKSFKLQQVQKIKKSIDTVSSNNTNPTSTSSSSNSIENSVSKAATEVICLDSDDEAPEILCETTMRKTNKVGQSVMLHGNFNGASSSNPFDISNTGLMTSFQMSPFSLTNLSPLTIPMQNNIEESSPFNIIISNVTSVPAEFFASVPEESTEELTPTIEFPALTATQSPEAQQKPPLKRPRPTEDNEIKVFTKMSKQARLDNDSTVNDNTESSVAVPSSSTSILNTLTVDAAARSLSNVTLASSSKVNTTTTGAGSNGVSLENCHRDAGSTPTVYDNGYVNVRTTVPAYFAAGDGKSKLPFDIPTTDSEANTTARNLSEPISGSCCSSRSSKPRCSSSDRTRLIPDIVRLSDLKFRIFEDNIELSLGNRKIQVKRNCELKNTDSKSNEPSSDYNQSMSSSPLESQYVSSDKSSSKPNFLRFDDSATESTHSRHLRSRGLKNFVYEDDNTLLEYPTSNIDTSGGAKLMKKSNKQGRNELKENLDPEVSSSSKNNVLDNVNNNQTSSSDLKDIFNSLEKSTKDDDSTSLVKKEDSDTNQRLLRRSGRTIRHFRSIKSSNGLIDSDSVSQSVEKSNQTIDQPIRNTRSQKVIKDSDSQKENNHLKNVDINDLRFDLTGKVKRDDEEIDADEDFRVSIDLQKLKNFMSVKPDLFLKTNGVHGKLHIYNVNVKLRVELSTGETKYLTKSQSFDCLSDIDKNDDFQFNHIKCKSLNDLSQIASINNSKLTVKRGYVDKRVRRSQRRKSKRFEKHECVR